MRAKILLLFLLSVSFCFATTAGDILQQLIQSQNSITSYSATIKTTSTINGRVIVSNSKIYTKGSTKSRMEIGLPGGGKQTIIANNGKCYMNSPSLKAPIIKDVGTTTSAPVDNTQAVNGFINSLKENTLIIVANLGDNRYELKGESKDTNAKIHFIDFIVDLEKKSIENLKLLDKDNNIYAEYAISSIMIKNIWTMNKMSITSNPQAGITLKIENEYSNIKVNEDISESLFAIN